MNSSFSITRFATIVFVLSALSGCREKVSSPVTPPASDSTLQPTAPPIDRPSAEIIPPAEVAEPAPAAQETIERSAVPQRSFRPPDERPRHDPLRITEFGIREYQSRRLLLYTDLEPETAEALPLLIDGAFEAWEDYFGPLPLARDGSDYQLTGYLMQDQNRFRRAGLLPATLPGFAHGKHDAQQFWMNDSEYEYFRRHLMIHEATHCFMQSMGGTTLDVPVWYLEGMAELFATHSLQEEGDIAFRTLPVRKEDYVGFGRIPMIQRAVAADRLLTVDDIARMQPQDFVRSNESYAWAWAICTWADGHPRYGKLLKKLGREYVDEGFHTANTRIFGPVMADFAAEWRLFARHLCYGFDVGRSAVDFTPGVRISANSSEHQTTVSASRGWQSSKLAVVKNATYEITAGGQAVLAQVPKPWESEPQGISIRYSEGRPIGRLLGLIISEPDAETGRRFLGEVIDIGRNATFSAPTDGTLYLRVNDFWNELDDNSGEYAITARVIAEDG